MKNRKKTAFYLNKSLAKIHSISNPFVVLEEHSGASPNDIMDCVPPDTNKSLVQGEDRVEQLSTKGVDHSGDQGPPRDPVPPGHSYCSTSAGDDSKFENLDEKILAFELNDMDMENFTHTQNKQIVTTDVEMSMMSSPI
ncbi:hypothetical protein KP509_39G041900 [Ceratopteris richardii]|uniref:Uncharacterized protein n=1 Tax=Ceratopteris richardii TaxID=49495 RepID=A0A8T2Q012_CERRI|nr:hypothetical protein KP509_39G041900 [Ceratopteris richardii]